MELEAQRCLVETQQLEIRRLRRQMEVHLRHTSHLKSLLDTVIVILERAGHVIEPAQKRHSNGNGATSFLVIRKSATTGAHDQDLTGRKG
jgi:hypothetical protein